MISKEEIKKLADLARIEMEDKEIENLRGEMDAILDYVGQVKSVAGDLGEDNEIGPLRNVMREDENPTESETFSKELIAEFPNKDKNYLKVKKIL
jgi:aspartyl-tRNA(Asn)/glutamyl-tRNA(Gln) amidotransferase subunit C